METKLTTKAAAKRLGVCVQRVSQRLRRGDFPNHTLCECGNSVLIPESDLLLAPIDNRKIKPRSTNEPL